MPEDILAIIPARGGSKGLPGKNILPLAGKPLLAYSIEQALAAEPVVAVYVSTDDPAIGSVARVYGAEVIWRPPEISDDWASSESVLIHALDQWMLHNVQIDLVLFLQCTSPLRRPDDITRAIQQFYATGADSLCSVAPSHRFLWRIGEDGQPESANWDYRQRSRRQDRAPEFWENGSIYLFRPWVLRQFNNRLGGKITLYEMDEWSSVDIDTYDEFELCEWLMTRRGMRQQGTGNL